MESMYGHSMEPNSSKGDEDVEFHSWSLLFYAFVAFLSLPYVPSTKVAFYGSLSLLEAQHVVLFGSKYRRNYTCIRTTGYNM